MAIDFPKMQRNHSKMDSELRVNMLKYSRQMVPLFLIGIYLLFTSCEKESALVYPDKPKCAEITVITPLFGLGDNGYNDAALAGIMDVASASDLEVSLLRPKTLEQAGEYVRQWSNDGKSKRRLLVLPDAEYSAILADVSTSATKSVLLFENDGKDVHSDIATFRISRYGSAYLAGCLAKGSQKAHIIQGKNGDSTCEEAMKGFIAGYSTVRPDGEIISHSLSDTYKGWSMPDSLYRIASQYPDDFFFPLAKGSNSGVYKFSRESPLVLMLIAGMDVDCSLFSKRVPFSVVIDVRSVVKDYVSRWNAGENISGHTDYGMKDDKASVRISSLFYEINDIWEGYYDDPLYWQNIYDANYEDALRKEAEYEAAR